MIKMFKLPSKIKEEIKNYKNSLEDLLNSRINPARFTGVRVPWGIYSHRGGKVFMNRIRIPAGVVNSSQLKAIAHVAKAYGNGIAHITTRQDIQIHNVKIEDTIKVMEYLKDFDLSPRGGGGNTVRNITACTFYGICKEEVFDVRSYAVSLSEYLLAQDTSYNLPRKFKIGFSGCQKDCAGCLVNDVGFVASPHKKRGFKVFVGGGMGADSRVGRLLEEFIPEEEMGYCVSAIKNVFYKYGNRKNKHHNRLRFLISDMGFDKFKTLYQDELKDLKENEYIVLRKIEFSLPDSTNEEFSKVDDGEFSDFLKFNIHEQKQKGLVSVELRIPRGDIAAEKLNLLADLEKDFGGIEFRTSGNQNLAISNLRKGQAHNLFLKVKGILADFTYASTLLDVVCCKGALTCNLGLCNSPGLTEELEKVIKKYFTGKTIFKKLNIKVNGCPNACGQHPIGLIGLHGMARKVSGRPVPFYKLLLGGRIGLENTRLAKDTGIMIPAKNVPLFLKDFIEKIDSDIDESTDIYKYIDEKGQALAQEIAVNYAYVPGYSQNKDFYIDWGKTEDFSLEGLGPGECGAGVLDMIDADLTDTNIALEKAKANNYSISEIRQALFFSTRALLVVKGSDPRNEEKACLDFVEKFVKEGVAPEQYLNLPEFLVSLKEGLTIKEREEKFLFVKDFAESVKAVYKNMDPGLNFPKQKPALAKEEKEKVSLLDLKGVRCPMNYVQAKLYLENIKIGEIVELCLDEGEPIQNVPASLKNDGQEILEIKKLDGFYKVRVKKMV